MSKAFTFFTRRSGAGQIRGRQVAEYIGGKVDPPNGYENDICIYVKRRADDDKWPKYSYADVVDEPWVLHWVRRHPEVGVISISRIADEFLRKDLNRKDIVFIPEHHCNFERVLREPREIKTVGVIGGINSFQFSFNDLKERLAKIGLEWTFSQQYKNRFDVINFYKTIDIQIIYRPFTNWPLLRNPLKLENAGSFGIPTVAYPEESYDDEWKDSYIRAMTVDEIINQVRELKENPDYYADISQRALKRSEDYHIEHISKLYLKLAGGQENIEFRINGKLLAKEVVIDGKKTLVYGLASFRVNPRNKGIGKEALKGMESVAKKDGKAGIVAFCDPGVLGFYTDSGWSVCGSYEGRNIICSIPAKEIEVKERW